MSKPFREMPMIERAAVIISALFLTGFGLLAAYWPYIAPLFGYDRG
jgi:hypothetical protein